MSLSENEPPTATIALFRPGGQPNRAVDISTKESDTAQIASARVVVPEPASEQGR